MPKNNKCDAEVCFGAAGNRCPRVRCELCALSVHIKCANISSALHKSLRESPGVCWLCVKCRDVNSRQTNSSDTIELILQRTTSSLKLTGALLDSMRLFCRMYSESSSCPAPQQIALALDVNRSLGEAFQDPLNFTNLFDSIIGDKRQRTSSISRPSSSPPEKIAKVDVPIATIPTTTTTVSSISEDSHVTGDDHCIGDASALAVTPGTTERAASDAITQIRTPAIVNESPLATTPTASMVAAAERAAALAVEQVNIRAAKHAAELAAVHAAELATARAAVHAAKQTATQVARQAAEQVATQAATHATTAVMPTAHTADWTDAYTTVLATAPTSDQATILPAAQYVIASAPVPVATPAIEHVTISTATTNNLLLNFKCASCGGKHKSNFWECPIRQKKMLVNSDSKYKRNAHRFHHRIIYGNS